MLAKSIDALALFFVLLFFLMGAMFFVLPFSSHFSAHLIYVIHNEPKTLYILGSLCVGIALLFSFIIFSIRRFLHLQIKIHPYAYSLDKNIVQRLVQQYFSTEMGHLHIEPTIQLLSKGRLELIMKLPQKIETKDFLSKIQKELRHKLYKECGYQNELLLTLLFK